ncbi:hypothetical protein C3L33_17552, partial [Rhododendron williamsianum]
MVAGRSPVNQMMCGGPSVRSSTLAGLPPHAPPSLTRRADNLRRLARVYTDHYWGMVEELKGKYKEYVWKYGLSPYEEGDGDEGRGIKDLEGNMNNAHALCAFNGCALKAMALTRFCHLHILSDSKQCYTSPVNMRSRGF